MSRTASLAQAQALAIVAPGLHRLAPVAVLEIPAHGRASGPSSNPWRGGQPSSRPNLRRVDRIAPIVAGTIGHERLELR